MFGLTPVLIFGLLISCSTWAAIPYKVTVNDPKNDLGVDKEALLANLDAAVADWARFIKSNGELWIHLDVTRETSGLFGGVSCDYRFVEVRGGYEVFEDSGTYKLRTGQSVNPKWPMIHPAL